MGQNTKASPMTSPLKILPVLLTAVLLVSACAPPVPGSATPSFSPLDRPPETEIVTSIPTLDPTLAALQLAVYLPEARTGRADLDAVIDALLAHDFPTIKRLTSYLVIGCSASGGLGGPPACLEGEEPGTVVESVPFLGPEGRHQRRPEYESWAGPDVLGLLAAYRTSEGTYTDPAYPAGEYALVFLLASGIETVTLQVESGSIVRYDFGMGGISPQDLASKASQIILPLSFQPQPTPVPWKEFQDPGGRFSFVYPPTLIISQEQGSDSWILGGQIRVEVLSKEISWITCFDQALGDCPVVESDRTLQIHGVEVRRVSGYIGAVGGNIPQEFLTHIFPLDSGFLAITLYALPFDSQVSDVSQIWPLEGMMQELYQRTVETVQLSK